MSLEHVAWKRPQKAPLLYDGPRVSSLDIAGEEDLHELALKLDQLSGRETGQVDYLSFCH